jgi:hypothetical protein
MRAGVRTLGAAAALAGIAVLGVACATVAGIDAADTTPSKQHCIDGMQDDGETGFDCGGPDCLACGSAPCTADADCQSGTCTDQKCAIATCSDGVWDGYESSLDCGDPRGELISCPLCPVGVHCWNGCNCLSGSCDPTTNTCGSGTPNCDYCTDHVQDNNETGVDCGGPCPPCADGGVDGG